MSNEQNANPKIEIRNLTVDELFKLMKFFILIPLEGMNSGSIHQFKISSSLKEWLVLVEQENESDRSISIGLLGIFGIDKSNLYKIKNIVANRDQSIESFCTSISQYTSIFYIANSEYASESDLIDLCRLLIKTVFNSYRQNKNHFTSSEKLDGFFESNYWFFARHFLRNFIYITHDVKISKLYHSFTVMSLIILPIMLFFASTLLLFYQPDLLYVLISCISYIVTLLIGFAYPEPCKIDISPYETMDELLHQLKRYYSR